MRNAILYGLFLLVILFFHPAQKNKNAANDKSINSKIDMQIKQHPVNDFKIQKSDSLNKSIETIHKIKRNNTSKFSVTASGDNNILYYDLALSAFNPAQLPTP